MTRKEDMEMIETRSGLLAYLERIGYEKLHDRIAVEALIFTSEGKLLLQRRGEAAQDEVGKLEGVGGALGERSDLRKRLEEKIATEIGDDVDVNIERLLEVRLVPFTDRYGKVNEWVVVSYLCQLKSGTPVIGLPRHTESLHYLTLDQVYAMPEEKISKSLVQGRVTYRAKYGNRPYFEIESEA